jgi:hypothetical protein
MQKAYQDRRSLKENVMDEATEGGAKAKGNKGNKGKNKPRKAGAAEKNSGADGQIGRMLVRAIWAQEWSAANPGGKGEARKAAWKDARSAMMEKNLKSYRRAMASLKRSGVTMTLSAEAAAKSGDDDNDE